MFKIKVITSSAFYHFKHTARLGDIHAQTKFIEAHSNGGAIHAFNCSTIVMAFWSAFPKTIRQLQFIQNAAVSKRTRRNEHTGPRPSGFSLVTLPKEYILKFARHLLFGDQNKVVISLKNTDPGGLWELQDAVSW